MVPRRYFYERGTAVPREIEVDDTYIYWKESNAVGPQILRALKAGAGTVDVLGEWYGYDVQAHLIAVDSEYVYWRYDTKIRKWSKTNRTVSEIDLGAGHVHGGMLVDDGFIYVADDYCAAVASWRRRHPT